ncbi:MAG: ATP-binding cassette domain-containing protein, partial [Elusimicrobiota bacterium]
MISVSGLSKSFGETRAVSEIDFEVREGEVMGFLGPNGAGKTTTLRMLSGFLPPSSGAALVAGRDIAREIATRMGPSLAIAVPTFVLGLFVAISFALLLVFFRATALDFAGVVL